jgi:hypothetical protein
MQRDLLLLTEMIDAAEQAQQLVDGITVSELEADRQRRDALLWNFTVLGEAAGQVSGEIKARFPDIAWQQPPRLRNPYRARLLVNRSGSPAYDCHRATACFRRQPAPGTQRPRRRHLSRANRRAHG